MKTEDFQISKTMGTAQGQIVIKENRLPLKNLSVAIFDTTRSSSNPKSSQENREGLGSAITDDKGHFEISWESDRIDAGKLIDIQLVVSGPEGPDAKKTIILYESPIRKTNKVATESFFIEIPSTVLSKFNILTPESPLHSSVAISAIKQAASQKEILEEEWMKIAKTRVERKRVTKKTFQKTIMTKLFKDIATSPKNIKENKGLVVESDPERTVEKLTQKSLKAGVSKLSGSNTNAEGNKRKTRFFLTSEQREKLDELLGAQAGGNQTISQSELEEVLTFGENLSNFNKPVSLVEESTFFERFFQKTIDEDCAENLLKPGVEGDENSDSQESNSEGQFTKTAMKTQLSKVMKDIDSPMGVLAGRPGQEDVIGNIREFALKPGPADTPALYDFQKLSIAFDHVWKEFLDERIEPLAQAIYMSIVERGGNPEASLGGDKKVLDVLDEEEFLIHSAKINSAPFSLYAHSFNTGEIGILDNGIGPGVVDPGPRIPPLDPPPIGPRQPPVGGVEVSVTDQGKFEMPPNPSLIQKLRDILKGKYAFTAFGADANNKAINFGLVVTYRQRWEPVSYQVGELHKTITLAPGESRKYSRKTKLTRKRAEKEVEKNSSILKDEFDVTTRAESEIIRKARSKTNFNIVSEGSYNFGIASGDATTTIDNDSENSSDDAKKSFREAVIKSSQEYRQERTLDISTEESFEFEETETGELKNTNNEITVTYMFFELQRRFRINEKIHKATPVILVAQDLPRPNDINEAFLVRHGWIFKRVLLDDMYEPTLAYVAGPLAGDKVARLALHTAMIDHRKIVEELKDDLVAMKEQASTGYEELRRAVEARIQTIIDEDTDGFFSDVGNFFGGGGQSTAGEEARVEAARAHEQRAVEQVKQLTMALQREITAYQEATEKYTKAYKKFKEWELRIYDLLVHIKENILHYMQAVWAYEHPDQRFLRLHDQLAPGFVESNGGAQYQFLEELSEMTHETVASDGSITVRTAVEFQYTPNFEVEFNQKTLVEIADLDTLLGFKGNYMIFPLRESNALTDFMLVPYVDAGFRLLDPHEPGNINREDFARYVCYLRENLDDDKFEEIRPALLERFEKLLLSPESNGDEIIVPTGSAYIEALPGSNSLLEDFKLAHRAIDVVGAQESVRQTSLENIRRAARILEEKLSDPDIDKKVIVDGENIGVNIDE